MPLISTATISKTSKSLNWLSCLVQKTLRTEATRVLLSDDLAERVLAMLPIDVWPPVIVEETAELDRYEQLDYLMTFVKLRARRLIKHTG